MILDAQALVLRLSVLTPTSPVVISVDQQLPVAELDPLLQQLRSHQLSRISLLSQQQVAP